MVEGCGREGVEERGVVVEERCGGRVWWRGVVVEGGSGWCTSLHVYKEHL